MLKTQILAQQIAFRLEFWNRCGDHIDKLRSRLIKLNIWKRLTTLNTCRVTKYHKSLRVVKNFIHNLWLCNIATVMVQYMQIRVLLVSWLRRGRVRAIIADCIQPATDHDEDWIRFASRCRFLFVQIVFVCLQSLLLCIYLQTILLESVQYISFWSVECLLCTNAISEEKAHNNSYGRQ